MEKSSKGSSQVVDIKTVLSVTQSPEKVNNIMVLAKYGSIEDFFRCLEKHDGEHNTNMAIMKYRRILRSELSELGEYINYNQYINVWSSQSHSQIKEYIERMFLEHVSWSLYIRTVTLITSNKENMDRLYHIYMDNNNVRLVTALIEVELEQELQ